MELTIDYLSEMFDSFNKEYFNNGLQKPNFEITHVKSYLGQYDCQKFWDGSLLWHVIRISDRYDRSEEDVCNTLIHEMIHLYIAQNNIRDTRPHHGKVFYGIADRINKEGGWHIARCNSVDGCGLRNNEHKTFYVCCFYIFSKKSYYRFAINKNYIEYYKSLFNKYLHYYQEPIIFTSTDDKAYAHYRECRKSVRGYYIDKEEYNHIKESENIIYQTIIRKAV